MEGRLDPDLVVRADVVVDRHMEGVGVVLSVGHAGDDAVLLLVDADEPARKPLCRRRDETEV